MSPLRLSLIFFILIICAWDLNEAKKSKGKHKSKSKSKSSKSSRSSEEYGPNGLLCHQCKDASSHGECNEFPPTLCLGKNTVCETIVLPSRSGFSITKQCQNPKYCKSPWYFCSPHNNRYCQLCCQGSLCNAYKSASCPNLRGDPGLPAIKGIQGPKGERGPDGDRGLPGFPGQKGEPGDPAPMTSMPPRPPKGEKGEPGDNGIPGLDGPQGERGLQGDDGLSGLPGQVGEPGTPGLPGLIGAKGDLGPRGEPGDCHNCDSDSGKRTPAVAVHRNRVRQGRTTEDLEFNIIRLDNDYYDVSSHEFIAPRSGIYMFTLTSIADGDGAVPLALYKNDKEVSNTARPSSSAVGPYPIGTNVAYLPLDKDDAVSVKVIGRSGGFLGAVRGLFRDPSRVSWTGHYVSPLEVTL